MTDTYAEFATSLVAPPAGAFVVTPSSGDLAQVTRALYVGSAGDLHVQMLWGGTIVFANVAAGSLLPIRCSKVLPTTTAQSIVGLY